MCTVLLICVCVCVFVHICVQTEGFADMFNPSLLLGCKFQLLPRTEGFLIYSELNIHSECIVHQR